MVAIAALISLPAALLWAATTDFLTMTISNRISIGLAVAFLILALPLGLSLSEIGLSLAAAACVFLVCFGLFAANVMGGGDAKILTAASLWFGLTPALISFLVYVAYTGGVVTLLFLLLRWRAPSVLAMGIPLPMSVVEAKKIPYGIAIAIGGILAFPNAPTTLMALQSF
ncbi:prepilin peptidase [Aliirhizobium terrae]|uniref:A24 family peptidase n=1 Tax=Terrirhizobium terrae TaxID=2926709 RepID=UPI00257866F8|nr:prepilin peptidase [Rhizobium sp. CC-CFT758]WJH42224.1 prepilin peptidase [Rhizobium sp. CC-CFT758]